MDAIVDLDVGRPGIQEAAVSIDVAAENDVVGGEPVQGFAENRLSSDLTSMVSAPDSPWTFNEPVGSAKVKALLKLMPS